MDSRRAEEVGIGTMLMKPFTLVNLAAHVRRFLDAAKPKAQGSKLKKKNF